MIGRIALVAAVASEGLAAYVVAEWFAAGYGEGNHHATPALGFCAVVLAAFFVPRLVEWLDLRQRPAMAIIGAAAYLTLYGIVRVQFAGDFAIWDLSWVVDFVRDPGGTMEGNAHVLVGTLLLVGVWARGAQRSAADVELEALPRSVTLPFIVVTAIVAISVYTERAGEVARAGAAYYVVAMLGVALGQLSLSGASFGDLRAGGTVFALFAGTLGAAIACVAVFWVVFGLIVPVAGPWVETAIFYTVTGIVWPFAWVLDKLFTFLFGDLASFEGLSLPEPQTLVEQGEREGESAPGPVERGGIYATRILMLAAVLGGIALLVAWLTRLRNRARRAAADGQATSLAGAFREDVRSLVGSLFRRDTASRGRVPSTPARRLYMEVLERASSTGLQRHADETPSEIAPRLSSAFHTSVTDEITAAFLLSRYAGREPDPRIVAELERRWRLIEE